MSCNTCNTPASSGGNLPAKSSAYLTDPLTATPDTCSQATANPCSLEVSRRRGLADFIPGWLQKVTAATSGKLLVARGNVLHYFKGSNPGPLYFDGEEVTVAEQATLVTAAVQGSILERGWNVIARKVKRPKVMPNGSVVDREFFDFGVQALRNETTGELPVLVIDPTSGMSRIDVAEFTEHNLVKKGFPLGLKRIGFQAEQVDGGCGKVERKKFLALSGAAWKEDELVSGGLVGKVPYLIPVTLPSGESYYAMGFLDGGASVIFSSETTEEGIESKLEGFTGIQVHWTDEDGDSRVSTKSPAGVWHHLPGRPFKSIVPVELAKVTGATSQSEALSIAEFTDVPVGAKAVQLRLSSSLGPGSVASNFSRARAWQVPGGDDSTNFSGQSIVFGVGSAVMSTCSVIVELGENSQVGIEVNSIHASGVASVHVTGFFLG